MVIKSNLSRSLSAAFFFTGLSVLCSVFFMDITNPNTDPKKMQIARYITPIIFMITIYYWYRIIQIKSYRLFIEKHKISWGDPKNLVDIDWTEIATITVINLSDVGTQSGWCYEFTRKNKTLDLGSPITLLADDYAISHLELMNIFEHKAKQYSFILET